MKTNIAELLKDCPKGMELDCASYDNVSFDKISDDKKAAYPIFCYITDKEGNRSGISFTENGCESKRYGAKCVIFPKGKTTWEGFVPPCQFKDGDILTSELGSIFILKEPDENKPSYGCYIAFDFVSKIVKNCTQLCSKKGCRFATEDEKQRLFESIKENGYRWNSETKTLEKLIQPKFKVGDKIEKCMYRFTIAEVKDDYYLTKCGNKIPIDNQDDFSLVPNKFDITTLKPFDKVLVRDGAGFWRPNLFGKDMIVGYRYFTASGSYKECIPYEGNEHLLGTTTDCDDFYKTWEK